MEKKSIALPEKNSKIPRRRSVVTGFIEEDCPSQCRNWLTLEQAFTSFLVVVSYAVSTDAQGLLAMQRLPGSAPTTPLYRYGRIAVFSVFCKTFEKCTGISDDRHLIHSWYTICPPDFKIAIFQLAQNFVKLCPHELTNHVRAIWAEGRKWHPIGPKTESSQLFHRFWGGSWSAVHNSGPIGGT